MDCVLIYKLRYYLHYNFYYQNIIEKNIKAEAQYDHVVKALFKTKASGLSIFDFLLGYTTKGFFPLKNIVVVVTEVAESVGVVLYLCFNR